MKTDLTSHIELHSDAEKGGQITYDEQWQSAVFEMFFTYANPIASVIRETVSNAYDALTEMKLVPTLSDEELTEQLYPEDKLDYFRKKFAEKEVKPIVVEIIDPISEFDGNYIFSVKDQGVGISPVRMKGIWSSLFTSTKRKSNDQIGGWGLGAKSPLGYDDTFTLISRWEGTEYHYVIAKADPAPVFELLLEQPTDEPNGVEVQVSIKEGDLYSFKDSILKQICYFDNIQYINCGPEKDKAIYKGKTFVYSQNSGLNDGLHICYGKVYYPIDWNAFSNLSHEIRYLQDLSIGLYFDIGELRVTRMRESLEYNNETTNKITARLKELVAEVKERVSEQALCHSIEDYIRKVNSNGRYSFSLYLDDDVHFDIPKEIFNVNYKLAGYNDNNQLDLSKKIFRNYSVNYFINNGSVSKYRSTSANHHIKSESVFNHPKKEDSGYINYFYIHSGEDKIGKAKLDYIYDKVKDITKGTCYRTYIIQKKPTYNYASGKTFIFSKKYILDGLRTLSDDVSSFDNAAKDDGDSFIFETLNDRQRNFIRQYRTRFEGHELQYGHYDLTHNELRISVNEDGYTWIIRYLELDEIKIIVKFQKEVDKIFKKYWPDISDPDFTPTEAFLQERKRRRSLLAGAKKALLPVKTASPYTNSIPIKLLQMEKNKFQWKMQRLDASFAKYRGMVIYGDSKDSIDLEKAATAFFHNKSFWNKYMTRLNGKALLFIKISRANFQFIKKYFPNAVNIKMIQKNKKSVLHLIRYATAKLVYKKLESVINDNGCFDQNFMEMLNKTDRSLYKNFFKLEKFLEQYYFKFVMETGNVVYHSTGSRFQKADDALDPICQLIKESTEHDLDPEVLKWYGIVKHALADYPLLQYLTAPNIETEHVINYIDQIDGFGESYRSKKRQQKVNKLKKKYA